MQTVQFRPVGKKFFAREFAMVARPAVASMRFSRATKNLGDLQDLPEFHNPVEQVPCG
jgi:hypothetical protein